MWEDCGETALGEWTCLWGAPNPKPHLWVLQTRYVCRKMTLCLRLTALECHSKHIVSRLGPVRLEKLKCSLLTPAPNRWQQLKIAKRQNERGKWGWLWIHYEAMLGPCWDIFGLTFLHSNYSIFSSRWFFLCGAVRWYWWLCLYAGFKSDVDQAESGESTRWWFWFNSNRNLIHSWMTNKTPPDLWQLEKKKKATSNAT